MTTVATAITTAVMVTVAALVATTMANVVSQAFTTCTVPASLTRTWAPHLTLPPAGPSCADRIFGH